MTSGFAAGVSRDKGREVMFHVDSKQGGVNPSAAKSQLATKDQICAITASEKVENIRSITLPISLLFVCR